MKVNYTDEDLCDHHAVSAVIKDEHGNILMQNHVKYGFWTIPIGKAKSNQTPIEGIKEEVFEECNIIIEDIKEVVYKEINYERNGKQVRALTHVFEVMKYSGDIENKEPEKHTEQKFIPLEDIMKIPYLSDATILFLESIGLKRDAKLS